MFYLGIKAFYLNTDYRGDLVPLLKGKPTPRFYTFPRRNRDRGKTICRLATEDRRPLCLRVSRALIKGGNQTWIFAFTIY